MCVCVCVCVRERERERERDLCSLNEINGSGEDGHDSLYHRQLFLVLQATVSVLQATLAVLQREKDLSSLNEINGSGEDGHDCHGQAAEEGHDVQPPYQRPTHI